jgi:hypothetical protein
MDMEPRIRYGEGIGLGVSIKIFDTSKCIGMSG